jgi:hypothetical protein
MSVTHVTHESLLNDLYLAICNGTVDESVFTKLQMVRFFRPRNLLLTAPMVIITVDWLVRTPIIFVSFKQIAD